VAAVIVAVDGSAERLLASDALARLIAAPHVVCHAGFLISRLSFAAGSARDEAAAARAQRHLDAAELFAFTLPVLTAPPTPSGFARALGLPASPDDAAALASVVAELLARLASRDFPNPRETATTASALERTNWPWASAVLTALRQGHPDLSVSAFATGLNVWDRLPEWQEDGPRPPGSHTPVDAGEAKQLLASLLGSAAEARPQQIDYCTTAAGAFQPRQSPTENHILLAEAGTGLGKTLGYLAPSYLWARQNHQPVWISTYTKNLQRQLEQETARLIADPQDRRRQIVVRKGRENYVCLLNMQEAFSRLTAGNPRTMLLAALIARWARYSRDGDMVGGDFPAWLMGLLMEPSGPQARPPGPSSLGLTDRRGECIYAACPHYRKCFIERNVRASRKADIVIANHALVLHQAAVDQALGQPVTQDEQDAAGRLGRLVFDEGHHIFDAADSAFSGHLTGFETAELRRWVRGPETRGRRGRSLEDRLGELIDDDDEAERCAVEIRDGVKALPGPGWQRRIEAGTPDGDAEQFLILVRQQVLARTQANKAQNLEPDCRPMNELAARLLERLDTDAAELASSERARIEALARSLKRRGEIMAGGWVDTLARLIDAADPRFVDWFAIEQQFGREVDVGLHSHWVDPSEPLAATVLTEADSVIITSATLKDRPPDAPDDWRDAEMRTGAVHLPYPVARAQFDSPFDYRRNARIIVVDDISRQDVDQLAAAYRELFLAAGGSALGLFTAISRLKLVHRRIAAPLAEAGLPLYAQHVDPMDTGTLVDMFRAERDACLLGTDAVRDGIDVPGDALRLIVLDRVPWPQPSILHRARRQAFGGNAYQDMLVRLKLRQAFGRLIRQQDDRGVFVILDSRLATRFCTAFPAGIKITRTGLVEALDQVKEFIGPCSRQDD
ncbi:MAG: ATP-dependent DNA helicase, partial [Aestuariivirgaceae bacterium]